jgi:hypothetical protein
LGACLVERAEEGFDPMSKPLDITEQRKLQAVARRYKRDGYRVTIPEPGMPLPAFLEGYAPDLIAESENDRVVIEVKQNSALLGSNDLRELADRVASEPGWRFELVTIPSVEKLSIPAAERIDYIAERARQALRVGLPDAAYTYAFSVVEVLLNDLARQNGLDDAKMPLAKLVRDLVSRGVIPHETLDAIEQARAIRNRVVHADEQIVPSVADVERLLALGQRLRSELSGAAAA